MFLKVEGDVLINVPLVEKIEVNAHKRLATLWAGGVILFSDSRIAFEYFTHEDQEGLYVRLPAKQEKVA